MKSNFEYIKKWVLQDQTGISKQQIIDGVVNLCNDALAEIESAQLAGEAVSAYCVCENEKYHGMDRHGCCRACGKEVVLQSHLP